MHCTVINIANNNEKSTKINNYDDCNRNMIKISLMMRLILACYISFHNFRIDAARCCAKKNNYTENSPCKYFCTCCGTPNKKHDRNKKVDNDDDVVVSTRWSKITCIPVQVG